MRFEEERVLHIMKVQMRAASTTVEAVSNCPKELDKITDNKNATPGHRFSV